MKKDKIIKFSNNLALLLIGILIYWVFIFISITIFDFKIFRENITEAFFLSIMGIIALLSGSIIVNIMFNLTKISESLGKDKEEKEEQPKINKKIIISVALSFLIIFGLLYFGDLRSTQKKHDQLVSSAEYLIKENQHILQDFVNYKFTKSYLFSSHDGFYELYYPVTIDAKTIILYFTDQQRYGKYGS